MTSAPPMASNAPGRRDALCSAVHRWQSSVFDVGWKRPPRPPRSGVRGGSYEVPGQKGAP
jgi:hypothetical protein